MAYPHDSSPSAVCTYRLISIIAAAGVRRSPVMLTAGPGSCWCRDNLDPERQLWHVAIAVLIRT